MQLLLAGFELLRRRPHSRHDLWRGRHGIGFLIDLQILVADHVEQKAEDGSIVGGGQMLGEVRGADEHIVVLGERAVGVVAVEAAIVLAVDEEEVDPVQRTRRLQRVGDFP